MKARALRAASAALAVLALAAVAAPAAAYVRTQTDPYYGPPKDLWWGARSLTFFVNASAYHGGCGNGADGVRAASALIQRSVRVWETAAYLDEPPCTDVKLASCGDTGYQGHGYDQVNLIAVRTGPCSSHQDAICHPTNPDDIGACMEAYNCWSAGSRESQGGSILALTWVNYEPDTGEILDADVELNGWNGSLDAPTGFNFTCAPPGSGDCPSPFGGTDCVRFDLGHTVTHEVGHLLGLDHNFTELASMMYPSAAPGDTTRRDLGADDIAGICDIYPARGDTRTAVPLASHPVKDPMACSLPANGGGCASGEAGAASLAACAIAALARRRRR